jgi:hypothetical protein
VVGVVELDDVRTDGDRDADLAELAVKSSRSAACRGSRPTCTSSTRSTSASMSRESIASIRVGEAADLLDRDEPGESSISVGPLPISSLSDHARPSTLRGRTRPVARAELVLQDLAGRVAWHLVGQLELLRDLRTIRPRSFRKATISARRASPRPALDDGANACVSTSRPDHRHVGDLRVLVEESSTSFALMFSPFRMSRPSGVR